MSHTLTGLTNGTEHRFKLRAVNDGGNGPAAPVAHPLYVAATPSVSPPAAPTGLTATAGNGSVTLTWEDPSDTTITSYEYQMRWTGVAWSAWTTAAGSGATTVSHTLTGLTNGTEHRFKLRAVNDGGNGPAAPVAHPLYVAATPSVSPPAAPTGLTATAGNGSVTLTWEDPSDTTITSYEYQMRWTGVAWSAWTTAAGSGATTVSHTLTGLTNGTEHRFKLRAVNDGGTGQTAPAAHPPYVAATPSAPPPPAAPTGLTATAGNGIVALIWNDPSDTTITRYEYQMRQAGHAWGSWTTAAGSGATTVSHTLTGLTNGTEHRFRLRAVNDGGTGPTAPAAHPWYVAATPSAPPPPAAPTGLTATAGNGSVTLTWEDPSDTTITSYEYRKRWTGVAWSAWTTAAGSGATTVSHTLTGLTNGTEHRFKLRAVNDDGTGPTAPAAHPWYVAATPSALPPPAAPTGLTATAGNGSVALAWNDPSDTAITRYEYQSRQSGGAWSAWTAIADSGATTVSHTLTGLTNGTEHGFKLRAVNATGAGAAAAATATPATPLPAAPPNVVVIFVDDLGYKDVSFNGATDISTPNIDELADTGVTFTRGYTAGPLCTPSRVGLMTGRYPMRSGVQVNWIYFPQDPEDPLYGLASTEKTVATYLQAAGYRTGLVGKWQIGSADGLRPRDRGFDYFYGMLAGGHNYWGGNDSTSNNSYLYPLSEDLPYHWLLGTELRTLVDFTEVKPYLTDALTDKAIDFIDAAASATDPWFLYLPYTAPHNPLEAPAALITKYKALGHDDNRSRYLAMVDSLDQNVGRVLDAISAAGERDETLIFFLSDNGGVAGHQDWADNGALKWGKGSFYEGGVRVPFVASWPGRWPAGATYTRPVISLDIAATAMAMAGVNPDAGLPLDGVDLDGYVRSPSLGDPHEALYWHWWDSWDTSRTATYAAVSGDLKLVKEMSTESVELYNLSSDPGEATDLFDETSTEASQARTDAERLRTLWNSWNDDNKVSLYWGYGGYKSLQPWERAARTRQLLCQREGMTPLQIGTDFKIGAAASGAAALPSALSSGAAAAISVTSSGGATWDYTLPTGHTFVSTELRWRQHNTDDINDWTGRSSKVFTSRCDYLHKITGLSTGTAYKAKLVVTTRDSSQTDHTLDSNTATFTAS